MSEDPSRNKPFKYWAFISYSSLDRSLARWLHRRLESYPIPREFRSIQFEDGTTLGRSIRPVFRDRDELSGSADLGPAISKALAQSRYLIVLCSPNSARSEWVNKEIEDFRAMKGSGNILALILDGVPNATSNPAVSDALECFPPALRYPQEPLAGDLRKEGDGKERGFLKILSGVAQLDFDVLYRRHERAQRKQRLVLGVLAGSVILTLSGLSLYALQQKDKAQRQTVAAEESEKEATRERDQARQTLAKFYQERALRANSTSHSLAWLQKASEIDASTLDKPEINRKARFWLDPWPAPDTCLGTGQVGSSRYASTVVEPIHSKRWKRIISLTGQRSWNIMDWQARELVGEFDFSEGVQAIRDAMDGECFVVSGRNGLELRSWNDGSLLHRVSGEYSVLNFTSCSMGVCLATYHYQEKETRIRFIVKKGDGWEESEVSRLKGEAGSLSASAHEGKARVFVVTDVDEEGLTTIAGYESDPVGTGWRMLPIEHPAGLKRCFFQNRAISVPGDCVFLTQSSGDETWLFDPHALTFTPIEIDDGMIPHAIIERGGHLHWIGTREEPGSPNDQRAYLKSLADGTEEPLLEGGVFREFAFCPIGQAIAAWNGDDHKLCHQTIGGDMLSLLLETPLDWPFINVHQITEQSEGVLLIEAFSQDRKLVSLVDLDRPAAEAFHFAAASDFQTCLDFGQDAGGYSMVGMTHEGRAVSYFKHLLTPAEWIVRSPARRSGFDGVPQYLSVDDRGVESLLLMQSENEERKLAWTSGGGQPPAWHQTDSSGITDYSDSVSVTELSAGNIYFRDGSETKIFAPGGELLHDGSGDESLVFEKAGDLFLLEKQGDELVSRNLSTREILWKVPFTRNWNGAVHLPDQNQVVILSYGFLFGLLGEEDSGFLGLITINLTDGSQTVCQSDVTPAEMKRTLEYGNQFQLLTGRQPRLIHRFESENGVSVRRLLEPVKGKLAETLRWNCEGEMVPIEVVLDDGSFLTRETQQAGSAGMLTHFQKNGDLWEAKRLPAGGSVSGMFPNPQGTTCVVHTEENMILFDLTTHQQVGGFLALPEADSSIHAGFKCTWSPDGKTFFLWDDDRVHQFDGTRGQHLREVIAHTRRGIHDPALEIRHFAVSPDGNWISTADAKGGVITTKDSVARTTREELQQKSLTLGGLVVQGDDDLVPWVPPRIHGKGD